MNSWDFVYRMKHVREGERRSRRKLGLSPGLKTYPFEPGVPRFWYKLVVEVPVPVPVDAWSVSHPHGHASFCKQNPFLSKLSNSEYQTDIAFKS
jgi:hypothetical protein